MERLGFTIRTHHLCMSEDIVPKFLEFSHGVKPWEYPPERFFKIVQFVKQYVMDEIDKDVSMRNFFENHIIDSESAVRDYNYVLDLIGTDNETKERVLKGRTDFYMEMFELAAADKNNRIVLSPVPDGYCKSCAIGKHCDETGPDDRSSDLHYKKALERFLDTQEGAFCDANGAIGINKEGNMFITAELFFNPIFIVALELQANAIKLSYAKAGSD
jgi:hypothetical protein